MALPYIGPGLEMSELPHHRFTYHRSEDWVGITSAQARKRLQNRLNQRACRQRKSKIVHTQARDQLPKTATIIHRRRAALDDFAQDALTSYSAGDPRADHLLDLLHLNFVRGLTTNSSLLNIQVDWLDCNSISNIGLIGPQREFSPKCPLNLVPTMLQSQVPHHPWIDLFPLPRMRENFLALVEVLSLEEETRLWEDIVESKSPGMDWTGLILWGEPWDPRSWEATLPFLRKWGNLLLGCPELIASTNYWRARRGEGRIIFA